MALPNAAIEDLTVLGNKFPCIALFHQLQCKHTERFPVPYDTVCLLPPEAFQILASGSDDELSDATFRIANTVRILGAKRS
jgi:hypothetical protein